MEMVMNALDVLDDAKLAEMLHVEPDTVRRMNAGCLAHIRTSELIEFQRHCERFFGIGAVKAKDHHGGQNRD